MKITDALRFWFFYCHVAISAVVVKQWYHKLDECEKKCFLPSEALPDENVRGLFLDESDTSQFGDPVNLFYVQFVKQIYSVMRGQNV